ncbi:Tubulin-specific chaperone A [Turdus rufiventris]|nr:Tubulin-specific chaperone A [Turdus rufiventris]
MADPRLRQIKIKTGVVRRHRKFCKLHKTVGLILNIDVINSHKWNYFTGWGAEVKERVSEGKCIKMLAKEKIMYEKEAKQQEEKIEKMKAEACDDYGIKKQIEILQESRMMIPDCQRRLEVAHAELTQLLENEKELEEAEEYKEARSILESVKLEA